MKAFVTGATGFIGRRLVEKLYKDGIEVMALTRSEQPKLPQGVKVVRGDILEPESFSKSVKNSDRLYHLAALITFDPEQRSELFRVNGEGTKNILKAAGQWNVERTVVVSSACTIGMSYHVDDILNEETSFEERLAKNNPYLASKLLTEQEAAHSSQEQTTVIVNPTTVYGPGDWSLNSGTLIQKVSQSPLMPVPPGGSNVVDVDDVIEGILAAGEKGQSGQRYILGGPNLRFRQIFSTVAEVIGRHPLLIPVPPWLCLPMSGATWFVGKMTGSRFFTPQIVGDMFAFKYYSSERAQQELGWKPHYTFQESVDRACMFYAQEKLINLKR